MAELKERTIIEKYNDGEKLSPEEEQEVMSQVHEEGSTGDEIRPPDENTEGKTEEPKDSEKPEKASEPVKEDEKAEPGKAEEKEPEKKAEETPKSEEKEGEDDLDFNKIDEVDKGLLDFTKLSHKEKGFYIAMKKERDKNKDLRDEINALKFREIKRRADKDEEVDLEGEDTDLVTKADLKKVMTSKKKKEPEVDVKVGEEAQYRKAMTAMWEREARKELDDYDVIVNTFGPQVFEANPVYAEEIAKTIQRQENPAITVYNLIKQDPNFEKMHKKLVGEKKKSDEKPATDTEAKNKKLKENLNKPKTTGAAGGGSSEVKEEMTLEKFASMGDDEFQALPRSKQNELLKRFG